MDTKLIVSASPHLRSEETTQSLMANVIVALCPMLDLFSSGFLTTLLVSSS